MPDRIQSNNAGDIRRQLQNLVETATGLIRSDATQSVALASRALDLAESVGDRWHSATALFVMVRARLMLGERSDEIVGYLRQAELLFAKLKDRGMRAQVWLVMASYQQGQGENTGVGRLFDRCIREFERLNDHKHLGIALQHKSRWQRMIGQYSLALASGLRAAGMLEQGGNERELGGCLYEIGLLYKRLGDIPTALQYMERGLIIRRNHGDRVGEAMTLHGIGSLHMDAKNYDAALEQFLMARDIYHEIHAYDREATAINSIGTVYDGKGEQKTALKYYKQAMRVAEHYKAYRYLGRIYYNISRVYRMAESYPSAIVYIRKAKKIAQHDGDKQLLYMLDHERSNMYEEREDYKRALSYYIDYSKAKEALMGEERQKMIYEIQTRHEVERLEREKEIEALKAARLQQEMDSKNRELSMLAMQLTQKNQLLARLTEELQALKNEQGPTTLKSTVARIEEYLQSGDGWETFSKQFNLVHPRFARKLAREFPELTPTEVRICCLLRVGLVSKDIASMLYITVRTVELHRGHIRKKLGLDNGASLSGSIAAL